MHRILACVTLGVLVSTSSMTPVAARDWPSWRGPENLGISRETKLPGTWSPEGENVLWEKPYGARSAPVVFRGRVYILNRTYGDVNEDERLACLDAETGDLIWEDRFNVFLTDVPNTRVGWTNPVVDPETEQIYIHGVQGLLRAYDRNGKIVWERSLTEEFGRISGYGGRTHSPIIDEDRVIISFLNASWGPQGRGLHRYLALDKRTGAVLWWSEPGGPPADTTYSVPAVAVVDGVRLLIAGNADGNIYALKARTGEPVWKFRLSKRGINSSVVVRGHHVWISHSEENVDTGVLGRVVCIDARGKGDITTTNEVWRAEEITAGYASPALDGDNLYIADNSANVHCFDAMTGKAKWRATVGTAMRGSPVVADGKLYIGAMDGFFTVLDVSGDEPKVLSRHEFKLPDGRPREINGSVAIANGRVYIPTSHETYCIGAKSWDGASKAIEPLPAEAPAESGAAPALLAAVPADVTLYPGQSTFFGGRLFDDKGRLLREAKPEFSVEGIQGEITPDGRLTIPESSSFQQGFVVAKQGELTARARVRVVPPLPIEITFEDVPVGKQPPGWVGATPVRFQVVEKDGSKVLVKKADDPRFMLAYAFFGLPSWKEYTIQADVLGTTKRRQLPNIGLIGCRYELWLLGNFQRLQLYSWAPGPRIEEKVSFTWKENVWYRVKLRVDEEGGEALVRAKIWPRDEDEPGEWTITLKDPNPTFEGSPGIQGYSAGTTDSSEGTLIYWDNITVTPNRD